MPIPSSPDLLANVLGYAADINPIPATTPSGSGAFSYQAGFPAITGVPLTAGGIAPSRQDFNGVFNLIGQHLYFLQSGSLYTWNSSLDYLKGAHILGSDGVEYIAQATSGPNVPDVGAKDPTADDGEYWTPAQGKTTGVKRGLISPYYNVTFGGSDGRRPIFWGETEADENYVLCDGGSDGAGGNVPDLRGKMIRGASDSEPAGSTGGSEDHAHSLSGTVGDTTLSEEQMASHAHGITVVTGYNGAGTGYQIWQGTADGNTKLTGGSQPHTHTLSGDSGKANGMPPYYTLAYVACIL